MPRSLTKRYISMVARDDAEALLADLPKGADPRDFHILGDLLPLRCAMYGSIRCLLALARSRPDLGEEILGLADSSGERCVDWAGSSADCAAAREISALAPIACSRPSGSGHWPLARALSMGRWDGAAHWLSLAPESAKLRGREGRGALHLCAEPGFDFLSGSDASAWQEPPIELARALVAAGADPQARNSKDFTALARAVASGCRSVFDAIFEALSTGEAAKLMQRGPCPFNAGHEAAWRSRPAMLSEMARRGLDLSELTAKGFGLFHLAIRQGSFECAQALFDLGAPQEPEGSSTSCPCSAMASAEPAKWIEWLSARGFDMDMRDDHHAHWAELAWEKLPLAQAEAFWLGLGARAPVRGAYSMFGPMERAARSEIQAAPKLARLLAAGMLPARMALAPKGALAAGEPEPSTEELLGRSRPAPIRAESFRERRQIELTPMWATEPEEGLHCPPGCKAPPGDGDDEDEDSFGFSQGSAKGSKEEPRHYRRPSLLAFCAVNNSADCLSLLLEWDAKAGHFSDLDRLCAWRSALRADANLAPLRLLAAELRSRGIALWAPADLQSALERLGPAKARELGAPIPGAGEAFDRWIKSAPRSRAFLLDPVAFTASHARRSASQRECMDQPWIGASLSPHAGAVKAVASAPGPWPAFSCLHAALSCACAGKGELVLWIAKLLPEKAKLADPLSPWGRSPGLALELWDQQLRFELREARSAPESPESRSASERLRGEFADAEFLPEGSLSSGLLSAMLAAGLEKPAASLVAAGLPAPTEFTRLANAIAERAEKATGIGMGNEALERLRSFCDALAKRADYRSIVNRTGGKPLLARLPDPGLLSCFEAAGADPGSGPNNAYVQLCSSFASRLTPGFAERLARSARELCPSMPLAAASALASMKRHATHSALDTAASAAARSRALRAARGVDELGWFSSFEQGACPVARAIESGNVDVALELAAMAPQGYAPRAGALWPALWLGTRLPTVGKALRAIERGANPEEAEKARRALAAAESELACLESMLGARFGLCADAEAEAAAAGMARADGKSRALLWAIERGFSPTGSISASGLGYPAERQLSRLFHARSESSPKTVPLACAALDDNSGDEGIVELFMAWDRLGLPSKLCESPDAPTVGSLLTPQQASQLERRILDSALAERPSSSKGATRL